MKTIIAPISKACDEKVVLRYQENIDTYVLLS